MQTLETLVEKVSESFLNYLHLWTWLDQKMIHHLSGRPRKTFVSAKDFWNSVFQEEIHPGDRVKFKEAFVTEWLPRAPGRIWHDELKNVRGRFSKNIDFLRRGNGFYSEGLLDSNNYDPLGVVRLPFGEDKIKYAALSITTVDSWCCDLGVPIIVSSSVYDAYLRRRTKRNSVEATIEGVAQFGEIPLLHPKLLSSIGSTVNPEFIKRISMQANFPSVYIQVVSPLDISFRTHNAHPPGFLWAIDREIRNAIITHYVEEKRIDIKPCDPFASYGLLTAHAQLQDNDDILSIVEAFKNASSVPLDKAPGGWRERPDLVAVETLTEFDARNKHFASKIPLEKEPWKSEEAKEIINRTFIDLENTSKQRGGIGDL